MFDRLFFKFFIETWLFACTTIMLIILIGIFYFDKVILYEPNKIILAFEIFMTLFSLIIAIAVYINDIIRLIKWKD